MNIIKLLSDTLFLKKYLDCEFIVESTVIEVSRGRNIWTGFIVITNGWKPRSFGF